jgi:Holliday junction resolvasome RuvABC endonuclease subunit
MGSLINLSDYKPKKKEQQWKPVAYPVVETEKDKELTERVERIKSSIIRINQLMAELRAMEKT